MKSIIILLPIAFFLSCNMSIKEQEKNSYKQQSTTEKIETIDVATETLKRTVSITMQDKNRQSLTLGSGAILGNGIVLTNYHVIEGATFGFAVVSSETQKHLIEGYYFIDKINDIAIISIPTIINEGFQISDSIPKIGEKIFTAGNPHGLSGTFSEGIISSIRKMDNKELIQITAPISPGSSGGPIVNSNALLVGIAVGGIVEGQNLNFAIPAKYFINLDYSSDLKLLSTLKPKRKINNVKTETNVDLTSLVKIRKIKWSNSHVPVEMQGTFGFELWPVELSILNMSSYPISNIRTLFIMYDNTGIPVDHDFYDFLTDGNVLSPGLAKAFDSPNGKMNCTNCLPNMTKEKGYKLEIRILDFSMHTNI